jgi:hypothetical protein
MYTYTMNENEMKYCVNCGFAMDDEWDYLNVCLTCGAFSAMNAEQLATYTPAVCGDDVCYLTDEAMPNFDGECNHEAEYDALFPAW